MVLISHKHRLLFIKTRKTAGSSIEAFLQPHLGPDDVVVSSDDAGAEVLYPDPMPSAIRSQLTEHMSAAEVRTVVGDDVWNAYYKVSIERSPWERMVSLWQWRQQTSGQKISFDDYLTAIEQRIETPFFTHKRRHWSNWLLYTSISVVTVDHIMQFESLTDEMAHLCQRVGIPFSGTLPHLKRQPQLLRDNRSPLTAEQARRVAALCYREIRHFKYKPPEANTLRTSEEGALV